MVDKMKDERAGVVQLNNFLFQTKDVFMFGRW